MAHFPVGTVVKAHEDPARKIRELAPHGFECFQVFFWQTLGSVDLPALAREVSAAAEETGTFISSLGIYGNVLEGNATAEECAEYCVALFSDLTRKVTMQNLFHYGGFSSMGMSLKAIEQYQKSFEECE